MARTDDDNWDLTSSVGVTATIVAVGRALATKDPRGLINDPFAEPLVRAVGLDLFTKMMDGELDMSTIADVSPAVAQAMVYGNAVRTKYFDDYLLNATAGGIRQVAILASGLDSRAYRLPWPTRTVVYEIDQPKVMEFKTTTLADLGAEPPPPSGAPCPSTCAQTGRRHYKPPGLTRQHRRRGWPRGY